MPKIGDRITSFHIMKILEPIKGIAVRYMDIKTAMLNHGWAHTDGAISNNFKALIKESKIVHVQYYYGIPIVRADGTAYVTVKNVGCEDEVIELGKLK